MSELKIYRDLEDYVAFDGGNCPSEVYDKSDVDKLIDEKEKEIQKWKVARDECERQFQAQAEETGKYLSQVLELKNKIEKLSNTQSKDLTNNCKKEGSMTNSKYVIKLMGLHLMSGSFAMLFCLNAKLWIALIIEGSHLSSIFVSTFIGVGLFVCMVMSIFKTFYVWASRQDPFDN